MKNVVSIENAKERYCCQLPRQLCHARKCMGWTTAFWRAKDGAKRGGPEPGAVEYGYCGLAGRPQE